MGFLCLRLRALDLTLCLVLVEVGCVGRVCAFGLIVYSSWRSFTYFGLFALVLLGLVFGVWGVASWLGVMLIVLILLFFGCVLSIDCWFTVMCFDKFGLGVV